MKEGKRGPFFPKLRVRIKDNNSSPHGKFNRFLFPFSCKFPDLNFASCVLYIYLCGTHSEPGLPVSNSSLPGSFIFVWVRVWRGAHSFNEANERFAAVLSSLGCLD